MRQRDQEDKDVIFYLSFSFRLQQKWFAYFFVSCCKKFAVADRNLYSAFVDAVDKHDRINMAIHAAGVAGYFHRTQAEKHRKNEERLISSTQEIRDNTMSHPVGLDCLRCV